MACRPRLRTSGSRTSQKENDAAGPYAFDPAKAKALLTSHGWTENSSKVMVCTKPGTAANECGAGVKAGDGVYDDA